MLKSQTTNIEKIQNMFEGMISETSTFNDVYCKCKSKLPMNKFMGASNNVRKNLKKIQTVNILGILEDKINKATNEKDISVLNLLLEDCITWITLLVSTSDACLKAFGHCEQNLKIGHFLVYYLSFLAVLARLHTLSKAIYFSIAKLAVEIKTELTKDLPFDQKNVAIEKFKQELLSTMGTSIEYTSLLDPNHVHLSVTLPESKEEDLGEIISRSDYQDETEKSSSRISKLPNNLETELKEALSVRNLRRIVRRESSKLSDTEKAEIDKILIETQSICNVLLNAKRLKIEQAGQLIACLMAKTEDIKSDFQESNVEFTDGGDPTVPDLKTEADASTPLLEKLLNSMPTATKFKKLCRESLSNVSKPKKRKIMNMLKKAKTDLVALKNAGNVKDYKRQMSILAKKIKGVTCSASIGKITPSSLDTSGMYDPLLDFSNVEENDSESNDLLYRKRALSKALKATKTMDGLLQTWNDLLCNKREDLNCFLPPNIKRSKLVCVRNNILKLKNVNKKHNLKMAIKKITGFVFGP